MTKQFLSTLINLIFKKLRFGFSLGQLGIRSIRNFDTGFSVIEVILAAAIFMIFATGAVGVVLQGLNSNRQGGEQTVANQFAAEGIEAVRSIKNQSFSNLVNSTGTGVTRSGNVWIFSPPNNTFTPSPNKTYTRVIKVEDVYRDGSGNIVANGTPGSTLDKNTKKITSTVTWNFSPTRNNSVILSNYLTDYRKPIIANGGLFIYGDATTIPEFRIYETTIDKFSKEVNAPTGDSGMTFVIKTSPIKAEAVAGYVTSGGDLHVLCYNGVTWTEEWTAAVGGTGTTRRFDIAYETNSGDVMVLYSRNVGSTNELGYQTKQGGCASTSNWSGAANFDPLRTSGIVQWVKMAWDRRASSNLITAIWADGASDLSTAVWTGTAWGNEPSAATETSLEVVSSAQDVDDFDIEYESLSGDVMVVWANSVGANGTNGVRYRTCQNNGGVTTYTGCTWGAVTTPPTFRDDATNLDISGSSTTDEIVFASIGDSASDLQLGYWSGSAWINNANVDQNTDTPIAGSKLVSTGWLISGATRRSIVAYNDNMASDIGWYVGNGSSFTAQPDFNPSPNFSNGQRWYDISMNPLSQNQLLLTVSNLNNALFAKRLVMSATPTFSWTNSDTAVLEPSLPQAINSPFSFVYWRNLTEQ